MALIECKECGKEISDKASLCPHCGYEEKDIASSLEKAGKNMQDIGCTLTLLITIPIILIFLLSSC